MSPIADIANRHPVGKVKSNDLLGYFSISEISEAYH